MVIRGQVMKAPALRRQPHPGSNNCSTLGPCAGPCNDGYCMLWRKYIRSGCAGCGGAIKRGERIIVQERGGAVAHVACVEIG